VSTSTEAIGGLVLAAGAGRRFGSRKQLAPLHGRPLLEHSLISMAASRRLGPVVVVLGAGAEEILERVPLHGATPVICEDWEEGQAASLRTGVAALAARVSAIIVVLGDQPAIDPRAIDALAGARDGVSLALRASYGGRPGHPVLLERGLFERIGRLRGDQGARELLAVVGAREVPCDGLGEDGDVDTPAALSEAGSSPPPAPAAPPRGPSVRRSPRP